MMMGLPALLCGLLFNALRGTSHLRCTMAGAVAGGLGTVLAAIFLAGLLATGGEDFLGVAKLALAAHIPVIFVEAAISAFTISFIYRVRPELLGPRRLQGRAGNQPRS